MMVGKAPWVVEAGGWHDFYCDYLEAVVRDCYSYPWTVWSCHLTEKAKLNCVPSKHTHLSLLGGAKVWSEQSCILTKCTVTIPTPKISSGWWWHQEWSTKQNINISHSKQVTRCEFQEQSAYISPEFMPMTRPLEQFITIALMASPRRMYWLLLALKRCSKDQNNKIKWKQPRQGWKATAQWCLNWSCVQGMFPTESCMWALPSPENHGMRDREEVSRKCATFKDAYISLEKGWYCRQMQRLPLKDTSSYRECHFCIALSFLKCRIQRRKSQRA